MELNYYNNSYSAKTASFGNAPQKTGEKKMFEEQVNSSIDELIQRAEREVPEYGIFSPVNIALKNEDPEVYAKNFKIGVETSAVDKNAKRKVVINADYPNSYRTASGTIFSGTKEEVLKFLKDNTSKKDIIRTLKMFSKDIEQEA